VINVMFGVCHQGQLPLCVVVAKTMRCFQGLGLCANRVCVRLGLPFSLKRSREVRLRAPWMSGRRTVYVVSLTG
jgi:hypothetical protein